ncbi:nitrite/sulfite reductase [Motiliproteus coralliicola]|uniref:Nitrite/sulfite reductase n=1 Tax=Motiliproteus coralliicola TaxID=2283196 RepID=A0A369WCV8_9GAMM|nr:nitrite/sulfite reductase [Motiliproteus coralliicola]RDE19467.1 nitrite/sulfite reductase [Motiliproteus coralliicola]
MYQYSEQDQRLIEERVEQYRDQTQRYLAGQIPEEEFRILRLQNGLYFQRHAPMLRVAINYGLMSSRQMRMLAKISRDYDKNYVHFTTRQNVQFNWPEMEKVPDILAELATVQMHAIQTSGSCIRSVTSDQFAGVVAGEIEDPRPWSEIIRQWAALHPEFAYLPRKFKIAVTGCEQDRAATQVHDIGVRLTKNDAGEVGFEVLVGGGLGRTPMIGKVIREFLPQQDLLSYLEAILRVYNLLGRRDNKYKARIKILVDSMGAEAFGAKVEAEWEQIRDTELKLTQAEIDRVKADFALPAYAADAASGSSYDEKLNSDQDFAVWIERNTFDHKVPGYRAVTLTLKGLLKAPGDVTDVQLDAIADLADQYNFGEVRSTHEQNLVFANINQADLYPLWQALVELDLARPVVGTINDMIVCPGLDFCSLANAETLSVSRQIQQKFDDLDYLYDLGEIKLKLSGCINACAHHHVGHIGILGVDKNGESYYQITLGGSSASDASLGKVLGKSIPRDDVASTLEKILSVFVEIREEGERFIDTVRRVGNKPFKERVYAAVN